MINEKAENNADSEEISSFFLIVKTVLAIILIVIGAIGVFFTTNGSNNQTIGAAATLIGFSIAGIAGLGAFMSFIGIVPVKGDTRFIAVIVLFLIALTASQIAMFGIALSVGAAAGWQPHWAGIVVWVVGFYLAVITIPNLMTFNWSAKMFAGMFAAGVCYVVAIMLIGGPVALAAIQAMNK